MYLHGGGSSKFEALLPGHSTLELAATNGFHGFTLDRPGYGDSEGLGFPVTSEDGLYAANAARLSEAIGDIWAQFGAGHPGVVVHGESIGGAVALHLASQWSQEAVHTWPLLGLTVADIGQTAPDAVTERWRTSPEEDIPDLPAVADTLGLGPVWTYPAWMMGGQRPPAPIPRAELMEVVGGWPTGWREIVTKIAVPVRYRIAEYDGLWVVSPELVAEFAAALETASPYVDAKVVRGSSHGIFASIVGDAYNFETLAFVALCAAVRDFPQVLSGA